jgi:DNA repair exonuclease SbcCD ATPase subunit
MKSLYNSIKPNRTSIEDINNLNFEIVQSENRKLERLENLYKENTKEQQRTELEAKIKQIKAELNNYFQKILEINTTLTSNKAGITVLDNYAKYSAGLVDNSETKMNEFINKMSKKPMTEEDRLKYFQFTEKLQKEYNKREGEKNRLVLDIIAKQEKLKEYKAKVGELEKQLEEVKREVSDVKNDLLYHYHKLLAEGRDTREEGLTWLIKAIWNVGSSVTVTHLPNFLDEKLIEYLFKISQMDIQNQVIKNELENRKNVLKMMIQRNKSLRKRTFSSGQIFQTEQSVNCY